MRIRNAKLQITHVESVCPPVRIAGFLYFFLSWQKFHGNLISCNPADGQFGSLKIKNGLSGDSNHSAGYFVILYWVTTEVKEM
jgi:hypothetical protein